MSALISSAKVVGASSDSIVMDELMVAADGLIVIVSFDRPFC